MLIAFLLNLKKMGCSSPAVPIEYNISKALEMHNQKRAHHEAPPLNINNELNLLAQEYSENLGKKKKPIHIIYKDEFLGENIYIYKGKDFNVESMVNAWYDEGKIYDNNSLNYQKNTSHFTQMIWKETSEVGFGFKRRGNIYYGVAFYYPPGNTLGEFKDNIIIKT